MADLVARAEPPFTIALSGGWGVGKSTIARSLVNTLRRRRVPAVLVDAWTEDSPNLRRSLVVAVAAATELPQGREDELSKREAVEKQIDAALTTTETEHRSRSALSGTRLRDRVKNASLGLILVSVALVLTFAGMLYLAYIQVLPVVQTLVSQLFVGLLLFLLLNSGFVFQPVAWSRSRGPAMERIVLERAFRARAAQKTGRRTNGARRIVVVVDNLDRLPGEDALRALGEIRSLVEFEESACIFIIPLDREALTRHVMTALEGKATHAVQGNGEDLSVPRRHASTAARDYLDKFFNLDVQVANPVATDIRVWAEKLADAVLPRTQGDDADFRLAVQIIARAAGSSPRQVKRILNGVATRANLTPDGAASLAQIALLQSALALVPRLGTTLADEPRHLANLLDKLRADPGATIEPGELGLAAASDEDVARLASLLVEFRDVALDVHTTRLVLALREDRRWRGVAEPERLETFLQSGDSEGFGALMGALTPTDANIALERACDWIEESGSAFPRDFANGLAAVVHHLDRQPALGAKMREHACEVYIAADDETVSRVTPDVAEFLFANSGGRRRASEAAQRFASVLDRYVEAGRPPSAGLVRAAQLGAAHVGEPTRAQLRSPVAKLPDDLLTSLFEPAIDRDLVEGPVLEVYLARATAIELATDDQAANVVALHRLAAAARSGLAVQVDTTSARLLSQLAAVPGDLSDGALRVLFEAADLFRAVPGTVQDQLALALAARSGTRRWEYFDLALRVPSSEVAHSQIMSHVAAWLSAPEASPADVRALIHPQVDVIRSGVPDWATRLLRRWIDAGVVALAQLVVDFGNSDERRLIPDFAQTSPDPPTRFREAAEALSDHASDLGQLTVRIADWVSTGAQPALLAELGPALVALDKRGIDTSPVGSAVAERAEKIADPSELAYLIDAVGAWAQAGWNVPGPVNDRLLARSLALGLDDGAAVAYFEYKGLTRQLEPLIANAIRNPTTGNDLALRLARRHRKNSAIGVALVARAASPGTSEDDARRLLEAAQGRGRPALDQREEYRALLDQIASRYPTLDDLVGGLRSRL
ncbi:MAG: hypothetical protein KatS3mg065_0558 [Chloroflexota bacterium]|nr:MAG: hypothetical protein KatS3mg065_0558 [Chloroflexota bacterium]